MQAEEQLVNIVGLKNHVRKFFPEYSTFRMLILSEPDFIPRSEIVVKLPLYWRLLEKERV